jgi:hypothetical protein
MNLMTDYLILPCIVYYNRRQDSALIDGFDNNVTLTEGYYDAG